MPKDDCALRPTPNPQPGAAQPRRRHRRSPRPLERSSGCLAITAYDALRSEIGSEMRSEIDTVILRDLAAEPTLSARRLAERLQLSQRAVEKHLAALQQKGRLLRQGSPRAGYWQVL